MKKKTALQIMFFLLGGLVIIHFLILIQIIPYDQVWAGRINSVEEMRTFEIMSIIVNVFMLSIFASKYRQLRQRKRNKVIDILIWVFACFFLLNTLGNLLAQSSIELIVGSTITLASALLCFRIVRKEKRVLS